MNSKWIWNPNFRLSKKIFEYQKFVKKCQISKLNRSITKLLEAAQINPMILEYYGLSEAILNQQVNKMEKFKEIKVYLYSIRSNNNNNFFLTY